MPAKYLFDTNIYIRCMLNRDFALRHADQYARYLPSTYFSSVVAQELIVGCTDDLALPGWKTFFGPSSAWGELSIPATRTGKRRGPSLLELASSVLILKARRLP